MLAVAEMYVKGVSTREAERVMREFGFDSLSSTRLGRAAKLRDDELEARRTRPLGRIACLLLDARQEKVRQGGIVRDAAVLSAIAIAIGIDLAKSVFRIRGVREDNTVALRRKLRRGQVLAFFAACPPCLVGLEARAGAHYRARELIAPGHDVRIMPACSYPQVVR